MSSSKCWRLYFACGLFAAWAGQLLAQAPAPAGGAAAPPAGPLPGTVVEDEKGYKTLVPYIDPKLKPAEAGKMKIQEGKARSFVWQILDGKMPLNGNETSFDYFYNKILFPTLTQTSDEALAALPEERQKLFRDHLERCSEPTVHVYLVNKVFDQMKAVVLENYHPAARYNAMLVISSLNDTDVVRVGGEKKVPEPMLAALPFIYEQFTKAENTDAIRVAALLGLVRHLEWDNFRGNANPPVPTINAALRAQIVKSLLDLAQQKEPPAGRNAAGHEWFRRRAIEGLTHAGYHKADAEIAATMETLLKDEKESLAIRCAAATAVGKLGFQAPVKLEPTPTAKELGYLALLACHSELTRVADLNKQELERLTRLQGGASGGYGGGYGGSADGGMPGRGMLPGGSGGVGLGPGASGSADGGAYSGPRPGGSVRPKGPGADGGSVGGMLEGGYGSAYGAGATAQASLDPKQYRFDHIRRRIRGQIYAVEIGLVGPDGFQRYLTEQKLAEAAAKPGAIAPASPPGQYVAPPRGVLVLAKDKKADEDFVKKVVEAVVKLARTVEETDTDLADLDKKLRKEMKALEAMTRKLAAATPVREASDLPEVPAAPPPPTPSPPVPGKLEAARPGAPAAPPPAAPSPAAPAAGAPAVGAPAPVRPGAPAPANGGGAPAAPPAAAAPPG